jgi:hypothetical protein
MRFFILAIFIGVLLVSALGGCAREVPAEEARTVPWYGAHKAQRDAKLKWCAEDAARQATPNCLNAGQAWHQAALSPNAKSFADGLKFQ